MKGKLSKLKRYMNNELRNNIINYISCKFSNIRNIDSEVEDIVNQAYLKLKLSQSYRKEKENFGYLARIAFNIAIDKFQKNSRYRRVSFDEVEEFIGIKDSDCVESDNIEIDFFKSIIEDFKEIERKIIELKYYEDKTFREIAEITGLKINTVLSLHRRVLLKLRKEFSMLARERSSNNDLEIYSSLRDSNRYFQII